MLIEKAEITKFIPQRSPFVMLDNLVEADKESLIGQFTIGDSVLSNDDYVSHGILIESLAQTCAAGIEYEAQQLRKQARVGFIGAISKLKVFGDVSKGDTIRTHISIITSFDQVILIQGKVTCEEREVLECQMKIVIP
jgi:3-hydroxyacyl-[acyl-carrier-protein] dehydratase